MIRSSFGRGRGSGRILAHGCVAREVEELAPLCPRPPARPFGRPSAGFLAPLESPRHLVLNENPLRQ